MSKPEMSREFLLGLAKGLEDEAAMAKASQFVDAIYERFYREIEEKLRALEPLERRVEELERVVYHEGNDY
jgi:iron-sulfur cluster repair protein YtfE (RIC family)